MKKVIRCAIIGSTATLAACAVPAYVNDVQKVIGSNTPAGTAFNQSLFQEYQAYTRSQAQTEIEWVDAADTARKALRIAAGETVLPDEVSGRSVPAARIPELTAARERLMRALAGGAGERVPAAAAKAQAAFDCWLEQEAENRPNGACRTTFLAHEPMLKTPHPAADAVAEAQRQFVVTFGLGSADLSAQSLQTLKEVATTQAQMHAPIVAVAGFTDTVGSPATNLRLARHRTDAVAGELVKLGVPPGLIATDALGEARPAVPTGNDVAEPRNRRVEVTLTGTAWGSTWGYGGHAYGDNSAGYYGRGWGGAYGYHGYAVFFASGSSHLSAEAVERLKQAVAAQKALNPKIVRVIGYTDRTGSMATNTRLARERAQAVAAEYAKLGGRAPMVESRPGDTWAMPHDGQARRVEIRFDE
jgi:outer membrane protein OmpA-like peptidoglycan-associated protein